VNNANGMNAVLAGQHSFFCIGVIHLVALQSKEAAYNFKIVFSPYDEFLSTTIHSPHSWKQEMPG